MAFARVSLFAAAVTIKVLVFVFSAKVVATEIEYYVPDNTTVLTIHLNSSWVNENVARNEVNNGATIEGQAFAKALNTDVRTQLGTIYVIKMLSLVEVVHKKCLEKT